MNEPINLFINEITKETCKLLVEHLPVIGGDDWWDDLVKEKLSYQQLKRIESGQVSKLEELDLAALMRVFDKNWSEIKDKEEYPYEGLNLVKEVQHIRNRFAHQVTAECPLDDVYRDLDTLKRYLVMIGSKTDLITKIDEHRYRIMEQMAGKSDGSNKPSSTELQTKITENKLSRGVNLDLFLRGKNISDEIRNLLKEKIFIGIDFGTSTTVVSFIRFDEESKALIAEPIPIKQYDEYGRCIEDHLVSTCIAWTGQQLLVGQGAAQLKSIYESGKNIWTLFKMLLGAQSVLYFRSDLSQDKSTVLIETPQQAATVFFRYLRQQAENFMQEKKLPGQAVYSVSVPASFEANQRTDLCTAINEAGLELPVYGIIDEPNAAFISYLVENLHSGSDFSNSMKERKCRVLVFDFGAGTCDISILEVGKEKDLFKSRNLAISQFQALGGDNIDRQIVRNYLLKQLVDQMDEEVNFTTTELKYTIIPKLQPTAEALKVQICKYVTNNWNGRDVHPFAESKRIVTGNDVEAFKIRSGMKLKIEKPSLSFADFAVTMEPFLTPDESEMSYANRKEDLVSIFEPVLSAMKKASIEKDDLDMILFIGGSSLNPFVQSAIQDYFGRFVESVVLSDLRTPVSKGVAYNSLVVNGLNCEIIKPITSETIYVITLNGGLKDLLPAGTEIPSEDFFVNNLEVQSDGQSRLELPICVTNEDKILQVIEVLPSPEKPFLKGEKITLSCCMDENKLLIVKAKVGSRKISITQLNPLANKELTPEDTKMLLAQQKLYASMLKNNGRPSVKAMLQYAYASQEAKRFIEAAEAFEAVERLDPNKDFSTKICYLFSRGDKSHLSSKWSAIAYERDPCATTAFNLALSKADEKDMGAYEKLMEESLKYDPEHIATLEDYGEYLIKKDPTRGLAMIETAFDSLKEDLEHNDLEEDDFFRLRRAAETLGRSDVVEQIDRKEKDLSGDERLFSDKYLAKSTEADRPRKRRD